MNRLYAVDTKFAQNVTAGEGGWTGVGRGAPGALVNENNVSVYTGETHIATGAGL